jgi:hypothetical protein
MGVYGAVTVVGKVAGAVESELLDVVDGAVADGAAGQEFELEARGLEAVGFDEKVCAHEYVLAAGAVSGHGHDGLGGAGLLEDPSGESVVERGCVEGPVMRREWPDQECGDDKGAGRPCGKRCGAPERNPWMALRYAPGREGENDGGGEA